MALALLGALAIGCQPRAETGTDNPKGVAASVPAEAKAAEPAPATPKEKATIEFIAGSVSVNNDGTWRAASIGDEVPQSGVIKTDKDSSCELSLGALAAVRIGAETTVTMKALSLGAANRSAELSIAEGSIASKVKKLAARDRFEIRTATAVCGVRGTEFLVRAEKGKAPFIAVKEGAVAVMPPSYDASKIEALGAKFGAEGLAEALIDTVVEASPVISANQESRIAIKDVERADMVVAKANTIFESKISEAKGQEPSASPSPSSTASKTSSASTASPASIPSSLPPEILKEVTQYKAQAASLVVPPKALSESSKEVLRDLPKLAPEASPEASAEAKQTGSVAVPAAAETPVAATAPAAVRSLPASDASLAAGIISEGGSFYAADASGSLLCLAADGSVTWKAKTANKQNSNSRPTVSGGVLLYAGDATLEAFDAKTGAKRFSVPLGSADSGFFGRRPLVVGNKIYLSCDSGLEVLGRDDGSKLPSIALPDGSDMTPSLYQGRLLIVTRSGLFCAVDPESGEISLKIQTKAMQPVATIPLVAGKRAYFADRKGLVVCVDLDSGKTRWETRLEQGKSVGVYNDLIEQGGILYAFAKGSIYALSEADGKPRFETIRDAATPPCIADGRLWYGGADKKIVAADPASGKKLAEYPSSDLAPSGQPALAKGTLVFPAGKSILTMSSNAGGN
jgi:outer membrane protein assembly factor BamB